ncbi:MAG: asparagine synthase-related protein [Desulfurococcales archaeon]|nr:asparagine synthase-related protein [Desulfurococcales archaeon]
MDCIAWARRLAASTRRSLGGCDCTLLSGGVDTSFIALAHPSPRGVTAVTVDLGGDDARYAGIVAERLGMEHTILRPSREEFLEALETATWLIGSIDPVEIAADAVHVLSISHASRAGCRCLATGDGGDELFLGYSFLFGRTREALRRWISEMAREAWLPTLYIAERLGVKAVAPLYSGEAKRIALEAPIECLIGERDGRVYGKYMLRLYIDERGLGEVAWRPKRPVTSGSGSLRLLSSLASSMRVDPPRGLDFKPPSRLHMFLASLLARRGPLPARCSDPRLACPVCGRCMNRRGYCRFCGAVRTPSGAVMHYSDELVAEE